MSQSRIQRRNRAAISDAALDVFSRQGLRGATLDEIASEAGLSKSNVLYYFESKEAIYQELLSGLLGTWLDPLRAMDPAGDPVAEIMGYVRRKLELTREMPRQSRLFASEVLRGAPVVAEYLHGPLRDLVDEKAALIEGWAAEGRIAPVSGRHLIISIWAETQHYADFDTQVCAVMGGTDPLAGVEQHLNTLFRRLIGA